MTTVELRPTGAADRDLLLRLWNDGRVMGSVGFPHGLGIDEPGFDRWLEATRANPDRAHFVVVAGGQPCGEAFYRVEGDTAGLDIKLVPEAWGRGIATAAMQSLIGRVFAVRPDVASVWTEPRDGNAPAQRLYHRCGLRPTGEVPHPGAARWALHRPPA